jgi:hypothetical protein
MLLMFLVVVRPLLALLAVVTSDTNGSHPSSTASMYVVYDVNDKSAPFGATLYGTGV